MFLPPSPRFTYNNQQLPQYQAVANAPQPSAPLANPLQGAPSAQPNQLQAMQAMMAAKGAEQFKTNMDQLGKNSTEIENQGGTPLDFGQKVGAMFGFNDYATPQGVDAARRVQSGMPQNMQGPAMPFEMMQKANMDMQPPTNTQAMGGGNFFPNWLTSLFS